MNQRVAGVMRAGLHPLELHTTKRDRSLWACMHHRGVARLGALELIAHKTLQARQLLLGRSLLGLYRGRLGVHLGTTAGKVVVAQPAVVLRAGVEHPADGLWRHGLDGLFNQGRAVRTRATVDQGDALRRHYKTVVGIEPRISLAALTQRTNNGVHIACHLLCLGGVERLLRMDSSHAQPDAHSKHKAFEFHTSP